MSFQIKKLHNFLNLLLLTGFFIGYSPILPGTFGSLIGILLTALIIKFKILYFTILAFLLIISFFLFKWSEKYFNKKDPKQVVLDEIIGIMLTFILLPKYDLKIYILGFFLFRLFDILKPFPIKELEKLDTSNAILFDDLIAGAFSNILIRIIFMK